MLVTSPARQSVMESPMRSDIPTLENSCQCGCGLIPVEGRAFVYGHRVGKSQPPVYLVDEETGCWTWQRTLYREGYAQMKFREKTCRAHTIFYEAAKGKVPKGLCLDHLCRNRACVNPDHLEVVTRGENVRRGLGTKLTREDVETIRSLRGTMTQDAIALRFGVHRTSVSHIFAGRKRVL